MKIGIILESNEPEKAWNAVRFGNAALKQGHSVKLFLMSAGVEAVNITGGKFDAVQQLRDFEQNKGEILACGTCIKSRNQPASELCPISTMVDCVQMVEWADKVVTF